MLISITSTQNVHLPALPLYFTYVHAGFPSPADDFIDTKLDLNSFLIKHPSATFFMRMGGGSMAGDGIAEGDVLVVDRSLEPQHNWIIVAILNGELVVKRYKKQGSRAILTANNGETVSVSEEADFEVWGIVTSVIHTFSKN